MSVSRNFWEHIVRTRKPSLHRRIQQILDELQRTGWDREALVHLGRIFYEFAGKYHQYATQRFNVSPSDAWKHAALLLGNIGDFLSRVDPKLYPKNHWTWIRNLLKSVRVPASPPVSAWYLQKLAEVLTDPALSKLPTLRDGILKAVKRNNLNAFHMLNILLDRSSAEDLEALEDQARALLRERGKKAFPKDKVGELVRELVVRNALYRLARLQADVDPTNYSRHVEVINQLFAERGLSFSPDALRKLPLVALAGALAVEGAYVEGRRVDPRYFLFLKALGTGQTPTLAESLLKDAPEWVHLIDEAVVPTANPNVEIIVSKKDLKSQAQALERFQTCQTPLYGEHADKLLFTPYNSGVVPLVVPAKDLRTGKVIGRVTVHFDENTGNIYITSAPFGKIGLEHYVEALETVARRINEKVGKPLFKRILVGDFSKEARIYRLPWGVHDTHLEEGRGKKEGVYYFVGKVVRTLE